MVLVVAGAAETARVLADYLTQLARYERELANWQRQRSDHLAETQQHVRDQARHVRQIQDWNTNRINNVRIGTRPVSPGLAPAAFAIPSPARPREPAGLHYRVFQNEEGLLPRAQTGYSYHEGQVAEARDGSRGQHRVVVLADDATGAVRARYCTSDHYGDNWRNTRRSFQQF